MNPETPATARLWCLCCNTWVIAWQEVTDACTCWLCGGCGKAYGLRPVPPAPAPWLPPTATLGMHLAAYRPGLQNTSAEPNPKVPGGSGPKVRGDLAARPGARSGTQDSGQRAPDRPAATALTQKDTHHVG